MELDIEPNIFTQTVEPLVKSARKSGATARALCGAFIRALETAYGDADVKEAAAAVSFARLLAQEGGAVNAKHAARLYGGPNTYSEESARKAARANHLIAIRDGGGGMHFPVWQFGPRGGTLPGLREALAILAPRTSVDDLAGPAFFLNKTTRLGGLSPLEALRLGGDMVTEVTRLAREAIE